MKPTRDIFFGETEDKPKEKPAEEGKILSKITTSSQKSSILPISTGGMIAVIGPESLDLVNGELAGLIEPWQYWGYCKHDSGCEVRHDITNIFIDYMTKKNTIRKLIMERFQKMNPNKYYKPGEDHIMAYRSVRDDFAVKYHKRYVMQIIGKRDSLFSVGIDGCVMTITQTLNKYWIVVPRLVKNDNIKYPSFFTILEIQPEDFTLQVIKELKAIFNDMNKHWTLVLICNQTFDENINQIEQFSEFTPDIFYKTFFDDRVYYTPEALK